MVGQRNIVVSGIEYYLLNITKIIYDCDGKETLTIGKTIGPKIELWKNNLSMQEKKSTN